MVFFFRLFSIIIVANFATARVAMGTRQDVVFMRQNAAQQERQGKGYQDSRRSTKDGENYYEVYSANKKNQPNEGNGFPNNSEDKHREGNVNIKEGSENIPATDQEGEVYSGEEKQGYEKATKTGVKYVGTKQEPIGEINIGINLDSFVSGFVQNAKSYGLNYSLINAPRRSAGADKDVAVFCMNKKRLCFTAVWEKGRDRLFRIAMVTAGDGTQQSARDVINSVHAFISTITPGLTRSHREGLMKAMGMPNSEMGIGSIVKPDGKRINYEYARSNKVGLVIIASSVYGG